MNDLGEKPYRRDVELYMALQGWASVTAVEVKEEPVRFYFSGARGRTAEKTLTQIEEEIQIK